MKRFLPGFCLAFILFSSICCLAETDGNRSKTLDGVQLTATLSETVFKAGSSGILTSSLSNLSTNSIKVDTTSPNVQMSELSIFLTDGDGKKYPVTPQFRSYFGPHTIITILPRGSLDETNKISFGATLKPGDYTLETRRLFSVGEKQFVVEAKPLKVCVTDGL